MKRITSVVALTAMIPALLAVAPIAVLSAAPAAAQSLEEVERLTRLGRTDEARTALESWWEGDRSQASRRDLQRGLWLRGRLTVDPVQAELDFQRLAVLYPSGPFTADAILRLAQGAWAMGDEVATRRYFETLRRDYPRSDAMASAERWMADRGPLPPPGDTPSRNAEAVDPPGRAAEAGGAGGSMDREPARGRPEAREQARRPGAERPAVERPGGERAPPEAGGGLSMNYSVQLGAFAEAERALALYDSIRAEGVDVRVVRVHGSQFTHVRVGHFAERSEAVERLEELTALGVKAALVRDDRAEEVIRPR